MPTVSVVLTTYNRANVLGGTIESILAQTFRDFELIVCDDCSPDDTEQVVRRYAQLDDRISYFRHPRNVGMPANLNEGVRRARGEYVANLHDGDLYVPDLLEKWKASLDRHPGAAFVFNYYRSMNPDGTMACINKEDLPEVFPGTLMLEKLFLRRWRFGSPVWGTVMARRSAYEKAGLFDPRFGFISDVDMWMRLAEEHDVAYVHEPLIGIPARETVPRQWTIRREDVLLNRMFREARVRHFRGRPFRLAIEMARHVGYVAGFRGFLMLARIKAALSVTKRRES